jgi:fructose-bisphosphate aldolase class 1
VESSVSKYEPARNYLERHEKRVGKGGIQATEKGSLAAFAKEQWEKVSKERLKALIATMPQRVKDLVAAKGGYTKW